MEILVYSVAVEEIVTRNERYKMKLENSEQIQELEGEGGRPTNMKP